MVRPQKGAHGAKNNSRSPWEIIWPSMINFNGRLHFQHVAHWSLTHSRFTPVRSKPIRSDHMRYSARSRWNQPFPAPSGEGKPRHSGRRMTGGGSHPPANTILPPIVDNPRNRTVPIGNSAIPGSSIDRRASMVFGRNRMVVAPPERGCDDH